VCEAGGDGARSTQPGSAAVPGDGTWGDGPELTHRRLRPNTRKSFCTPRATERCHRLPREAGDTQKPSEHGPVQPAASVPAGAGAGQGDLPPQPPCGSVQFAYSKLFTSRLCSARYLCFVALRYAGLSGYRGPFQQCCQGGRMMCWTSLPLPFPVHCVEPSQFQLLWLNSACLSGHLATTTLMEPWWWWELFLLTAVASISPKDTRKLE